MNPNLGKILRDAPELPCLPHALDKGEMNPAITERFLRVVKDSALVVKRVWEPFAGHTGQSRAQDISSVVGIPVLSFDLAPCDQRVLKRDSTKRGPECRIGGVLFHPPYFGSALMSGEEGEISAIIDPDEYKCCLGKTLSLAWPWMERGGLVCAVGRMYRHAGDVVNLLDWYVEVLEISGFTICSAWKSVPEVAIIAEKQPCARGQLCGE